MLLKVSNLFYSVPQLDKNICFYKVTFYLHLCQDGCMYWSKHKLRGGHVKRKRGSFVPFTYLDIALDMGYKVLIWHNCSVH